MGSDAELLPGSETVGAGSGYGINHSLFTTLFKCLRYRYYFQAIKSHELDLLALGNVYVMKSHKGEQVSIVNCRIRINNAEKVPNQANY